MKLRHITILYSRDQEFRLGEEDEKSEADYTETVRDIATVLKKEDFRVKTFEVNSYSFLQIPKIKTDIFFNLCYGIGNLDHTEHLIPELLEMAGLPYVGADSSSIVLTSDKVATKKVFLRHQIPTPEFQVINDLKFKLKKKLSFPLMTKPGNLDGSVGIGSGSVVKNMNELRQRVKYLLNRYHSPVLVEKYIEPREIRVPLIGNGKDIRVLPMSELVFGRIFEKQGIWKVDDFENKFIKDSLKYQNTQASCPANLDQAVQAQIRNYAVKAYRSVGAQDYARVDLRLDRNNHPYFLEVNTNPGIGKEDAMVTSAKAAGFTYASFILEILAIAKARYH